MKKISNFLWEAPMWQNLIAVWLISTAIIFGAFQLSTLIESTTQLRIFYGSAGMGALCTLIWWAMMGMSRKSQEFWSEAEKVEVLIESAITQKALTSIHQTEFKVLQKKSLGNAHNRELEKLYRRMKERFKSMTPKKLQWIKFNVNHYVKIKLTEQGYQHITMEHNRIARMTSSVKRKTVDDFKKEVDEQGYLSYQMHTFMDIFGGKYIMNNLFETNILIEKDEKDN